MVSAGKEFFRKRYCELGGDLIDIKVPQCLRINTLKTTAKELLLRLKSQGVVLEKIPFTKQGYFIKSSKFSLGACTEFLLGHHSLQEAASQVPVEVLNPNQGDLILDCCSSPGGKTTQIAAAMENQGLIVSYELKPHRIQSLMMNLERCGVENVVAYNDDVSRAKSLGLQFDKILLDAPCSGNYAADDTWFEKRELDGILRSAEIQRKLLKDAVSMLKDGGELVYSTCSLEPEENELNMQWAIQNLPVSLAKISLSIGDPGLTVVFGQQLPKEISQCKRFWPHKTNTQGFFIARLIKHEA